MKKVFSQIESNIYRETSRDRKLIEQITAPLVSGGSFSNRDHVRATIQLRRESQLQHLKRCFSSKTDPSIFTSIAPVLLNRWSETSCVFLALKSTSHFMPQSTVSCRSVFKLQFWNFLQRMWATVTKVGSYPVLLGSYFWENLSIVKFIAS